MFLYIFRDRHWQSIPSHMRQELGLTYEDDGEFYMSFRDFLRSVKGLPVASRWTIAARKKYLAFFRVLMKVLYSFNQVLWRARAVPPESGRGGDLRQHEAIRGLPLLRQLEEGQHGRRMRKQRTE